MKLQCKMFSDVERLIPSWFGPPFQRHGSLPSFLVPQGAKVNTKSYVEFILTPALQELKKHFKDRQFTFQQDGAPSYTWKKTQTWLEENFPSFWSKKLWPPSSPDLKTPWIILFSPFCWLMPMARLMSP